MITPLLLPFLFLLLLLLLLTVTVAVTVTATVTVIVTMAMDMAMTMAMTTTMTITTTITTTITVRSRPGWYALCERSSYGKASWQCKTYSSPRPGSRESSEVLVFSRVKSLPKGSLPRQLRNVRGHAGAIRRLLGTTGPYSALLVWVGSPWVGS